VKKVNDKVPILGDLPLIGRAFRSEGEIAQKRNQLIFVTANLVSPNGAP
jgi:general secretion pathway protein D